MARLAGQGCPDAQNPEIQRLPPLQHQVQLPFAGLEAGGPGVPDHIAVFRAARGNVQERVSAFDVERLRERHAESTAVRRGTDCMKRKCAGGKRGNFPDQAAASLCVRRADFRRGVHAPSAVCSVCPDSRKERFCCQGSERAAGRGAGQGLLFAHPSGAEA